MNGQGSAATQHLSDLREALLLNEGQAAVAWELGCQLAQILPAGGRLLAAGNGGSAAQAQHLTAELVGRYASDRKAFSGICLSAETSTLTAIANDYPPEELFARQVEAHGRTGDVLILLSTSGTSSNVVAAAQRAKRLGMQVWAITGPPDSPLANEAQVAICVAAPHTATVQEMHLTLIHLICAGFDATLGVDVIDHDEPKPRDRRTSQLASHR